MAEIVIDIRNDAQLAYTARAAHHVRGAVVVVTQNAGVRKTYYGVEADVAIGDEITAPLPCERFTVAVSWSPHDGQDDDKDEPFGSRCF